MNGKKIILVSVFIIICGTLQAQNTVNKELSTPLPDVTTQVKKKNLDTEESLKYMGSELFFQLKKRLHLTSEEEEKEAAKEKKEKKKVKLNIFGITIER